MKHLLLLAVLIYGLQAESITKLKITCKLNNGADCTRLGYLYHSGQGVKKNYLKAKKYYSKACNLNNSAGCNNLGFIYKEGQGVKQSYSEARKYYSKACNLNASSSCGYIGTLYREGLGVKQSYSEAKKYFSKACDLNGPSSCNALGFLYNKGQGVNQSYSEARKYYSKACNLNNGTGCHNLGLLYDKGEGVKRDYLKAKKYYIKACDLNVGAGCKNLGFLYREGLGVNQSYSETKKYFSKACDLNDGVGCSNLGYLYREGLDVNQSYSEAKKYYSKACDLNNDNGCSNLGYLYREGLGVNQSYSEAKKYYSKACDLNEPTACNNLGYLYRDAHGVKQDYLKAKKYYSKACDLNNGKGCRNLDYLNQRDQGVKQSYSKVEQQKIPQKISGQDTITSPRDGRKLSYSDVIELEEILKKYPDNLTARSKLLGYYFYKALRTHGRTATLENRRYHIYWLIKNHPGSKLAGMAETTIDPIGHKLADDEGYEVAKKLWAHQVKKNKTDKKILLNAAHFLRLHDKEYAEEYLKEANDPFALGELYTLGILRINMMNQNGLVSGIGTSQKDHSFAKKAKQALEDSSDLKVLSIATSFLLTRGVMLNMGRSKRLDIDPVEYAAKLIRRQEELCPSCGTSQWSQYYEIKRMMATSAEQKRTWAKHEFSELEKLWKLTDIRRYTNKKQSTYSLRKLTKVAFAAGEMTKAEDYARKLLKTKSALKGAKMYGRTTHDGNIILGRVALKKGNIKEAGKHLIKAGQISGGAGLSSFGPNMALAKELLEHGEKQVVLQYLELCKKFWSRGIPKLERWSTTIKKGNMPDFGANLSY